MVIFYPKSHIVYNPNYKEHALYKIILQKTQRIFYASSRLKHTKENTMEKITSFTIDHLRLVPGLYVSRIDYVKEHPVTTFDIRITNPNEEPVMNTAEVHTIEHLAATFLRNHEKYADKTIYFGPMGCRTGFYLILSGQYTSADILPLMKELFIFIYEFEGEIPGASAKDCGNYLDMNLGTAKYYAKKYLTEVLSNTREDQLNYPS